MATSIIVQNVSKRFGSTQAIDSVSLTVEAGEMFFLLGPSGCGKTTLLRSIAGFCDIDRGTIVLGEEDVTRMPAHRRETGMVFQSYALWPHLTIAENVAFGLRMRRVGREERAERVARALKLVKMADRAEARPNELSGGQQQRVALARALVVEPRCLLLDEPLSNLDAKLRIEMRSEIRRICKTAGLTAIYVTHDQKEALSTSDRIAVMRDGRVLQTGAPMDIYRNPLSDFVAGFIGEANRFVGRVREASPLGVAVDAEIGAIRGRAAGDLRGGADAVVVIRPEAVTVEPAGVRDDAWRFSGTVEESVYLGELAQHRILALGATGSPLRVRMSELNPKRALAVGATVQCAVNREDILVFKREDGV